MNTLIKFASILVALVTLIVPASAQFEKLSGISVATPPSTGTVTLTHEDLLRTARILRAEGVVEAGDDDYTDKNTKRRPVNMAELKVADVKTLTNFLAVMAEACERLATGVAVTYPSQEKVDELVKAFQKIKVLGPTGETSVSEIKNAYGITIAILQKRVVCSNPAVPPATLPAATPPSTAPAVDDPTKALLPPPVAAPSGIPAAPGAAVPAPTVPAATPVTPAPAPATAPAPAAPRIRIATIPGKTAADGLKKDPATPKGAVK